MSCCVSACLVIQPLLGWITRLSAAIRDELRVSACLVGTTRAREAIRDEELAFVRVIRARHIENHWSLAVMLFSHKSVKPAK
jgi:hypothetical protein